MEQFLGHLLAAGAHRQLVWVGAFATVRTLGHYDDGLLAAFHRQLVRSHLERAPLTRRFDLIITGFDVERVFRFCIEYTDDIAVLQDLHFDIFVLRLDHQFTLVCRDADDLR